MIETPNGNHPLSSSGPPRLGDGAWVRGIAHDLLNLIQATGGMLELLERSNSIPSPSNLLQNAMRTLDQMTELTERLQRGAPPTHIPWSAMKARITEAVAIGCGDRNIPVRIEDPRPDTTIYGDLNDFGRVFLNLTWNACRAMTGDAALHITATIVSGPTHRGQHTAGHAPTGACLRVGFRDIGSGMTAEQAAHPFDGYYRNESGGQGLGLATVRQLMERWGGWITVESRLGVGTTFFLYFPLAKD